tara:strand:- start:2009 stop:2692 length:684 start_codon:yes stop_codon:yes gene_type:complete
LKTQYYGFEIKDIMKQFVSAFNSIVIDRYNKDRSVEDSIQANFVYAPKERVIHDLVNKSQNMKLPVVSVSMSNVSRDKERVFNKIQGFYISKAQSPNAGSFDTNHLPTPIPINITVNMDILARFQTDMDQILSNFIPYNNPYIIISWRVPSSQNLLDDLEIRSEVLWSGDISLDYPKELSGTMPYRVSASTSFTIKGWLFKKSIDNNVANIFTVDSNFIPVSGFSYE